MLENSVRNITLSQGQAVQRPAYTDMTLDIAMSIVDLAVQQFI